MALREENLALAHHNIKQDLHVVLILCIIVVELIPSGGLGVSAHLSAGLPSFALITEPETMGIELNSIDRWLLDLGFFLDPDLGRVRNPFDFPRGEADPTLFECFVGLDRNSSLLLGADGSGKTAQLRKFAQDLENNPPVFYQSAVAFHAMLDNVCYIPAVKDSLSNHGLANLALDIDDAEIVDPQIITTILEHTCTEQREQRRIRFHIALPEKYRCIAERYEPWEIHWSPMQLVELLRLRLGWASKDKFDDLAQICAAEIQAPKETLCGLAHTPRRLFELGQYLIHVHVAMAPSAKVTKIQTSDWEALMAYEQFGRQIFHTQLILVNEPERISYSDSERTGRFNHLYAELKKLDDPEFERFLLFEFPDIYDKLSRGLRLDEKINLLLDHCHRNSGAIERALTKLRKFTTESSMKGNN